jgi:anti-sigma-K factor RskA
MNDERHGRERNRFDDLKEAYALGALSEGERREFEGYLAAHPELQAEVDDLSSIANLLALAPQEHEPSPELRRNLLSRIGGATDATLAEVPPRRGGLWGLFGSGRLAVAAAAVAFVATVGLFVWNVSLRGENEDLRAELQTRQTYELQGSGVAQNVRGEVVEIGHNRAVLMAENLPPTPEGKVYEAWLMRDDIPEPAGTFEPRDDGVAAMPLEGSTEDADAVAVTMEQDGGSSTPRGELLLTAKL